MILEYSDAEAAILGGILLRPEVVDEVDLQPSDFHDIAKRTWFEAMRALREANVKIDPVTLEAEITRRGCWPAAGGHGALSDYLALVPTADNIGHYVELVRKAAQTRAVINALGDVRASFNGGLEGEELLSRAYECLGQVAARAPERSATMDVIMRQTFAALQEAVNHKGEAPKDRVPTGFAELDAMIGGLPLGIVTVLAGRPAMGKSALARAIADNAAGAGYPAHTFSLEDTSETLGKRTIADHSRIDLEKLTTLDLMQGDMEGVSSAFYRLKEYGPAWLVDDEAGLSSAQIGMRVRKHARHLKTRLVVVDYLQHVHEPDARGDKQDYHRANSVMRAMVRLARAENLAVLLVCQLNRDLEKRPDGEKRPRMSDIRDSGTLEQDAKLILFVYRDEVYTKDKCQCPGTGEVIVGKNSNGRPGSVRLQWDGPSASYRDLSRRA